MPRITKKETARQAKARHAQGLKADFSKRSSKEILQPLREQVLEQRASKASSTESEGRGKSRDPKYYKDGGLFGDPIKRAQRKAKRKMRKDMKNAPVFPGPTRKTKRQQKRGLRQMRKQQGR